MARQEASCAGFGERASVHVLVGASAELLVLSGLLLPCAR